MHELSVMAGIIDVINTSAKENNIHKIRKVKLIVGQMSNAIPDSLRMAFDMLRDDGPFIEDAILEIETVKTQVKCHECNHQFQPEEGYIFTCPECKGLHTEIIAGEQLYVDFFEGDKIDDN
ncbi:hydrogenase maturation nickel metallochaperone HypA [Desulfuribacillus alkaliarsenatis]|uniref:Hydrogenase maturation factor HypA n=1 Tax=Desulfuribacillus alkaliarsenatis TaxID=766136 RepID=A0A1E5FYX3_9FIRM|nr:hydrogenase maturation nickel metallochaperone HypA [Desulfuribacillus alkaliarsenatis]OEF95783.1 hydrogenase maturation nickel metallochaperone HypA [Desulfuribacillus alkaliarsenatis]